MPDSAMRWGMGEVVADAWQAVLTSKGIVLTVILLTTCVPALIDTQLADRAAIQAGGIWGLFQLYLQLLLTSAVLGRFGMLPDRYDPRRPTMGRYPAAFGLSLLYLLAVGVGLILLLVPGLVMIVRWSLSSPALLSEDLGIVESLRRSWRLTGLRLGLMAALIGSAALVWVLAAIAFLLTYPEQGLVSWLPALLANFLIAIAFVAFWLLAVAAYRRLRQQEREQEA